VERNERVLGGRRMRHIHCQIGRHQCLPTAMGRSEVNACAISPRPPPLYIARSTYIIVEASDGYLPPAAFTVVERFAVGRACIFLIHGRRRCKFGILRWRMQAQERHVA
jgi:hypothetical protein